MSSNNFVGTYQMTIDDGGRITIPSAIIDSLILRHKGKTHRDVPLFLFIDPNQPIVLFDTLENCPLPFKLLTKRYLDKQSRIIIDKKFVKKKVILTGEGNYCVIQFSK